MTLKLVRKTFTAKSTIGDLFIGDRFECHTLEDIIREKKMDELIEAIRKAGLEPEGGDRK